MKQRIAAYLMAACLVLPGLSFAQVQPAEVFAQLQKLGGDWTGTTATGRTFDVSYRLTASGTVLVETWTMGSGRESMTLYHLDGDVLMATHYCPQGNQPRLRYVPGVDPAKLSFEFFDGTNLNVAEKWHQHSFWLKLIGPDAFSRAETYIENGTTAPDPTTSEPEEVVTYTRK